MFLTLLSLATLNGNSMTTKNPTATSEQMLLALAHDWTSTTGYLQRFERTTCTESWHTVGEKIAVSFGFKGLGWGIGLHDAGLPDLPAFSNNPRVFEGSRRSPVGVFALNLAFGKASKTEPDAKNIKLPYQQITQHLWAIDDPQSQYYNRVVDDQLVTKDWNSAEDMKFCMNDGVYEFAIYIEHNYEKPIPGKGSTFFIHVHRKPGSPTWGCTAFSREQVKKVITWLDPHKTPILVQLPVEVFNTLKSQWNLPDFKM
jgi:hypothetical protein